MTEFKRWFATTSGATDPDIHARTARENEYRNVWLAAMREARNMTCYHCEHNEDHMVCFVQGIRNEIDSLEKSQGIDGCSAAEHVRRVRDGE